jgi:glycosyltransferase involved in cell wall biosynthesis
MEEPKHQPTVLQGKFAAYLSWSQPFIHELITRLGGHVHNVVLCSRTENLDRFPVREIERVSLPFLVEPRLAAVAATRLRRRWNPDLMHAHFGWSGLRMVLLKQHLRVPFVVTFGGRDVGVQMGLPLFDELYRGLVQVADRMICVSRDLARQLVAFGADPSKVEVVYRGADLERFAFVDRAARDPGAPVELLMVGRLVEKKGHRYAFEAVRALLQQGHEVRLTVVGEGEAYHELRRLRRRLGIRREVAFPGVTSHAGVREYMEKADLLVHCAVTGAEGDREGIPNVVVEAQAMGLPVLGTRHGGIVEAVRDGETGLLVEERDVPALTRAMARLVGERELRLAMGRAARRFVDAEFNLERQVEQHVAIYEKVIAECAASPEWQQRSWMPEKFPEIILKTIGNWREFSIAELIEHALWREPSEGTIVDAAEGGQSWFDRVYAVRHWIPQSIKYPVKVVLGKALVAVIERRHRRRAG